MYSSTVKSLGHTDYMLDYIQTNEWRLEGNLCVKHHDEIIFEGKKHHRYKKKTIAWKIPRLLLSMYFEVLHNTEDVIYVFCIVFDLKGNRVMDITWKLSEDPKDKPEM